MLLVKRIFLSNLGNKEEQKGTGEDRRRSGKWQGGVAQGDRNNMDPVWGSSQWGSGNVGGTEEPVVVGLGDRE